MACDPSTLMAASACIDRCIPDGQKLAVLIYLACQNSGGGGTGTVQIYQGRDPAAPDDPTKAALNYPNGGGTLTQWDIGTQTWV